MSGAAGGAIHADPAGADLEQDILAALPPLRAFARALCGNPTTADDLVQETVVKAWSNLDKFTPGTNLRAWLTTILRNAFYSEHRKYRREVADPDGIAASRLVQKPNQIDHLEVRDFRAALAQLTEEQREALILVGAAGFAYEEAAVICGCAVGTVKSRVNRARARLAELLGDDGPEAGDPGAGAAELAGMAIGLTVEC